MADLKVSELPVISVATDDDLLIINDGNTTTSALNWTNLKASIDVLTGGTAYADGIDEDIWEYVTSTAADCDTAADADPSEIVAVGPNKTHTITVTDGVPGKPVTTATEG